MTFISTFQWNPTLWTYYRTLNVTCHLFTPLFMFIHLSLVHFAPPPRSHINFKNSKWLTYYLLAYYYYACVIVSLTWLANFLSHDYLSYKLTRFFIYFLLLSDEGPTLETLDYIIRIDSTPIFLYFVKLKIFFVVVVEFYYTWDSQPWRRRSVRSKFLISSIQRTLTPYQECKLNKFPLNTDYTEHWCTIRKYFALLFINIIQLNPLLILLYTYYSVYCLRL